MNYMNVCSRMDIGPELGRIRVGVVPYGTDVYLDQVFELRQSVNRQVTQQAVLDLTRPNTLAGSWIVREKNIITIYNISKIVKDYKNNTFLGKL